MAKEKSTRSGQNTDELYSSNWIHCDKLAFLVPVTGASKRRDNLKRINLQADGNKKEVRRTPIAKMKTIVEKKLDLLSTCTEAVTANANTKTPISTESSTTKISDFSLYVEDLRKGCPSGIDATEE